MPKMIEFYCSLHTILPAPTHISWLLDTTGWAGLGCGELRDGRSLAISSSCCSPEPSCLVTGTNTDQDGQEHQVPSCPDVGAQPGAQGPGTSAQAEVSSCHFLRVSQQPSRAQVPRTDTGTETHTCTDAQRLLTPAASTRIMGCDSPPHSSCWH